MTLTFPIIHPTANLSTHVLRNRMPSNSIPQFYIFFFSTLDPLLASTGITSVLFSPATFLFSYFQDPKIAPETRFTLDALAGFFASTVYLQVHLLRLRPTDIAVWKALQASILIQNAFMLGAFLRVKGREGKLNPAVWTGAEWGKQLAVVAAAGVRTAFLMGSGLEPGL